MERLNMNKYGEVDFERMIIGLICALLLVAISPILLGDFALGADVFDSQVPKYLSYLLICIFPLGLYKFISEKKA